MSYQITSTPYFRRMFNTSKKNGQLQRLREEYERIQEFNDRTIELKMRQVRLKRLFREIEEIKESQMPSPVTRRYSRSSGGGNGGIALRVVDKSPQMQRIEALARARELGQELSRRNAELAEQGVNAVPRGDLRLTSKRRAAAEYRRQASEVRERTAKRINYGNEQSKSNMQKIVQRRRHPSHSYSNAHSRSRSKGGFSRNTAGRPICSVVHTTPENSSLMDIEKRNRLQQRLSYGNARSNSNMERLSAGVITAPVRRVPQICLMSATSTVGEQTNLQAASYTNIYDKVAEHNFNDGDDMIITPDEDVDPETLRNVAGDDDSNVADVGMVADDGNYTDEANYDSELDMEQQRLVQMLVGIRTEAKTKRNLDDVDDCNANVPDQRPKAALSEATATSEPIESSLDSQALVSQETKVLRNLPKPPSDPFEEKVHQRAQDRWHLVSLTLPWFQAMPPSRLRDRRNNLGGKFRTTDGSSYEDALSTTARSSEKAIARAKKRRGPAKQPIPMHEVLLDCYNSYARGTQPQKYRNSKVRSLAGIFEH